MRNNTSSQVLSDRPNVNSESKALLPILPMHVHDLEKIAMDESEDLVWYLAYGSNLAEATFKGRRNIQPLDQKNVLVPGLELTFDLPALPYLEPRMANCRYAPPTDLDIDNVLTGEWTGKGAMLGVAYLVTAKDYRHILVTEGAGASYEFVEADAFVIDDEGRRTGEVIRSHTLMVPEGHMRLGEDGVDGEASLRYLTIIRTGAREHNLPPAYLAYLDALPHYRVTTLLQQIGRASFLALWALPLVSLTLLITLLLDQRGTAPAWMERARMALFDAMWGSYFEVWKPVFGEGEKTVEAIGVDGRVEEGARGGSKGGAIRLGERVEEMLETANVPIPQTIMEKTRA